MTRRRAGLLAIAWLAASCSRDARPAQDTAPVPARRATSGDRILAFAPSGAEAVLEIDLARLRRNPAVGPLVRAVTASELARPDLIGAADLLVFISYRIGESDAGQLVFAAGAEVERLPGARVLDPDLVAIGPPGLLDRVDLVRAGAEPALFDRSRAPARARPGHAGARPGRVAAHGGAARLRGPPVARAPPRARRGPHLAVGVGRRGRRSRRCRAAGRRGPRRGQDLARAVERVRDRLARSAPTRRLGLARTVAGTEVKVRGSDVRTVLVVGPRRLDRLVARVLARLTAPAEQEAPPGDRAGQAQ